MNRCLSSPKGSSGSGVQLSARRTIRRFAIVVAQPSPRSTVPGRRLLMIVCIWKQIVRPLADLFWLRLCRVVLFVQSLHVEGRLRLFNSLQELFVFERLVREALKAKRDFHLGNEL